MNDIIKKISRKENIPAGDLKKGVENGTVVIPLNNKRKNHIERPAAIGSGLSVKVNANIGASPDINDVQTELEKLRVSTMAGADTVMDLTISRDWEKILREVILNSAVPVGTVPVYGAVCSKSNIYELNERDFIDIVEKQAQMGVDFMTIHAGVTRKTARAYDESCRVGGMVSRGGKLLYRWMKNKERENPFYNCFDEVLKIASEYSVTISLGDGLRPGSIIDASDGAQYCELEVLGELSQRCMDAGVMVMIEGPGHVPIDKIKENISKEKKICNGAPFYVLGPLTTDIGAGYDHITSAIGGA
ncbi:MAG: phosphomethylpyrimidine synthase ThiC, partial [Elusimicrobiota bacterium]